MPHPVLYLHQEKVEFAKRSIKRERALGASAFSVVFETEQALTRRGCGRIEAGNLAREAYYEVTGEEAPE